MTEKLDKILLLGYLKAQAGENVRLKTIIGLITKGKFDIRRLPQTDYNRNRRQRLKSEGRCEYCGEPAATIVKKTRSWRSRYCEKHRVLRNKNQLAQKRKKLAVS